MQMKRGGREGNMKFTHLLFFPPQYIRIIITKARVVATVKLIRAHMAYCYSNFCRPIFNDGTETYFITTHCDILQQQCYKKKKKHNRDCSVNIDTDKLNVLSG